MTENKLPIGSTVFFILLCLSVIFGWTMLPILPDETSYLYITSRYFVDGGRTTFWPLCIDERVLSLSPLLIPHAIFFSIWNFISSPYLLRLISIFFNILGLSIFWILVYKNCKNKPKLFFYLFITFSLFASLALMPIALVSHRAEYLWILFLAFSFYVIQHKNNIWIYIIYIFLYTLLCFNHPKYFYFFPLVFIVIITIPNLNIYIRTLFSSLLLLISYYIYKLDLTQFLSCNNLPEMAVVNNSFNININDLLDGLNNARRDLILNFSIERFKVLVSRASFSESYSTNFLPSIPNLNSLLITKFLNYIFFILATICTFLFFTCLFIYLFLITKLVLNKNYVKSFHYLKLLLIGVGLLAHISLNKAQAFYDSVSWLILMMLYVTYFISLIKININFIINNLIVLKITQFFFITIIIINLYYVGIHIFYPLYLSKQENGVGLLKNSYYQNRSEISALSKSCGVDIHKDKLITDDYAYFLVQPSPITTPITWLWYGFNLKNKYSSEAEMYTDFWVQTEAYALNNSYKAVIANCPSLAIGFNNKNLFKTNQKEWNDSLCCLKF